MKVINCKSCVNNCDDRLSYSSSRRSFYIWCSYIHDFIIIFLRSIRNPIRQWPAPGWLVAQLLERCIGIADRPWRIVLLKVAYYATSSARNFATLCQLFRNSQIMLLISEIMLTKWRRFCTYRRAITTPNYDVFQVNCCCKFICVLWQFGPQLSKLAARISEPFVKCLQRLNDHTCIYWPNQKNIVLSWFKLTKTIANYNVESIKPRSKSTCLNSSQFFQHQ